MPPSLPPGVRPRSAPVSSSLPPGVKPRSARPAASSAPEILNEQGVSELERFEINTKAPTPESAVPWLQKRGYEAQLHNGEVIVRKRGQSVWRKIEPTGFLGGSGFLGKVGELARDLTTDAADEWGSVAATTKGAALGATGGTAVAGPVGGFVGGLGGAAGGSAAFEAARRGAGRLAGFEDPDFAGGIKEAALTGAIGEGAGKVLVGGAKLAGKGIKAALRARPGEGVGEALQLPLKRELAKEVVRDEAEGAIGTLGKKRTAELEEMLAKQENRQLNKAALAESSKKVQSAISRGRALADANERTSFSRTVRDVEFTPAPGAPPGRTMGRLTNTSIPDPARGFTADALKKNPEIASLLAESFGDEAAPMFADFAKRGSHSMRYREDFMAGLRSELGPEGFDAAIDRWTKNVSAYLLGHPELSTSLGPQVTSAAKSLLRGSRDPQAGRLVVETLSKQLRGTLVTPRLAAARDALEVAQIGHKQQLGVTSGAKKAYAALNPGDPHPFRPGAPVPGWIRSLLAEPISQIGRRVSFAAGKAGASPRMKALARVSPAALKGALIIALREDPGLAEALLE